MMPKPLLMFTLLWLGGCAELAYYDQAIDGHWQIMEARQPVDTRCCLSMSVLSMRTAVRRSGWPTYLHRPGRGRPPAAAPPLSQAGPAGVQRHGPLRGLNIELDLR